MVGAEELGQFVGLEAQIVIAHGDEVGVHLLHNAVVLGQNADLGVLAVLVLLAGGHDGGLGDQQGHGLTLHVCAHQRTVCVVVFQERNHGGSHGDHHLRRDVHIVHHLTVHVQNVVLVAAGDTLIGKAAVLVQRLLGGGHDILVLHVGGHILHLVGDPAGALFHLAIRRLNKAVAVDPGIGGQVGDQADVGAFRRLDGAHTAIVAVMDVTDVERGALTAQTAGAKSGDTPLMGQLCQRVGLVHKLAQRGGAEELLDSGGDGTNVDQGLRGDSVLILNGHALTDNTLHPGKADAELVLQQLAHAAETAVAQMVDVVLVAHAVSQAVEIVDGGQDVVHRDVLGKQIVQPIRHCLLQLLAGILLQQLLEDRDTDTLGDTHFLGVEVHEGGHVHHVVGKDLDGRAFHVDNRLVDAPGSQMLRLFTGEDLARLGQDLTGPGVCHRGSQLLICKTAGDVHLLVELIPADLRQVIPAGVKQQRLHQALAGVHRGGLAGAESAVDLQHGLLVGLAGVLLQCGDNAGILAKDLQDLSVRLETHCAEQAGDGKLAVFVNADIEDVAEVRLVLQPCAPIGDDGGGVEDVARLVLFSAVIHTGRADDLRDDDTLSAVDDEAAALGHQGEVAHVDLLLLDLLRLLVAETNFDMDGLGIRGVPRLALLHVVLGGLVHGVVDEAQLQISGIVVDHAHVLKDLLQTHIEEPLIALLLDLQQVGHLGDLVPANKALSQGIAEVYVFDHRCVHSRSSNSDSYRGRSMRYARVSCLPFLLHSCTVKRSVL